MSDNVPVAQKVNFDRENQCLTKLSYELDILRDRVQRHLGTRLCKSIMDNFERVDDTVIELTELINRHDIVPHNHVVR